MSKLDPELLAIQQVRKAIRELPASAQIKVLTYVVTGVYDQLTNAAKLPAPSDLSPAKPIAIGAGGIGGGLRDVGGPAQTMALPLDKPSPVSDYVGV